MDWQKIIEICRLKQEKFDRSYKCVNVERFTGEDTITKHFTILLETLEEVRALLNVNYARLTEGHKRAAEAFFWNLRGKLASVANKKEIELKLPETLHEKIEVNKILEKNRESHQSTVDRDQKEQNCEDTTKLKTTTDMAQTNVEFLRTASSLIPDFDGRIENLRSFTDALELVDSIKTTHEAVAVSLVKTKLKGNARNLIGNETSLPQIIATLRNSVKGESVEVISAKLMNLRQKNKTANDYTKEVSELTKALEGAYISDGLTNEIAMKYSTQQAVKAMTKNCSIEKVKVVMEAGTFSTMNDAVSKFVNSCTEATGNTSTVFHYVRRGNGHYRGGNRGRNRGRGGYYDNSGNRRNGDNNYNRSRRNNYNRNRGRSDNNRNVRITQSGNDQTPLSNQ